jgi:hypothetical protein
MTCFVSSTHTKRCPEECPFKAGNIRKLPGVKSGFAQSVATEILQKDSGLCLVLSGKVDNHTIAKRTDTDLLMACSNLFFLANYPLALTVRPIREDLRNTTDESQKTMTRILTVDGVLGESGCFHSMVCCCMVGVNLRNHVSSPVQTGLTQFSLDCIAHETETGHHFFRFLYPFNPRGTHLTQTPHYCNISTVLCFIIP